MDAFCTARGDGVVKVAISRLVGLTSRKSRTERGAPHYTDLADPPLWLEPGA